jgi:ATP-dependent Clp protease ATP-binding subunit ClpA
VLRLAQVLSRRTKNNSILVGPAGVGKTAIVEGLAQRIIAGTVPNELANKRVLALDISSLLSGTKYRGEFEGRAKKIIEEIRNANRSIILFVDEIHAVIQSQGTEGAINLSDILKPALARGDLQMIGATTHAEYEKYILTEPSLERRFQPIEVREPNDDETLSILKGVKDKYREYHGVEFTDAALVTAIAETKKNIKNRQLPDKAIDAIDEAASMVKVSHINKVIPALLHHAAIRKNPTIAVRWKKIQALDYRINRLKDSPTKRKLKTERERLEQMILDKNMIFVVDSDDVKAVVSEWVHELSI